MTSNSGSESSENLISAVIGFAFAACVVGVFYCGFSLLHELFGGDFIFGGIMLVMGIMMKVVGGFVVLILSITSMGALVRRLAQPGEQVPDSAIPAEISYPIVRRLTKLAEPVRDSATSESTSSSNVPHDSRQTVHSVPKWAQYLLLLIPQKNREHLLGDLEEEFRTILLPQYGLRKAQVYYWSHTLTSIVPYIFRFFKYVLGVAAILKIIGKTRA